MNAAARFCIGTAIGIVLIWILEYSLGLWQYWFPLGLRTELQIRRIRRKAERYMKGRDE